MKYKILFILLFVWLKVSAQPTLQDTTRLLVFDPVKSWVTTMLDVKTYVGAGGGGGTVTNTGGALTLNALVLGAGTNDTKVSTGLTTNGGSLLSLGVNATTIGQLKLFGNTSGDVTIQPTAAAGTATVQTLPATTGTLVNRVTTGNGVSASNSDGALSFTLGAITPTTVNGNTFTTGSSTYTGTAGQTYTFPTTTATIARTDAANTFTGIQTFSTPIAAGSVATMTATVGGGVPTPPNNTTTFLRGDGTFAVPSGGGGGGDLVDGGQSTGATVSYGTTDAQAAAIKTNSVERFSITGGASTGGAATLTNVTANTNTVQDVLTVRANSSGTAAASFGPGLLFQGESSTTDNQNMVRLSSIWTTATHASRTSALVYSDVSSAGAITERFRFSPSAMTTAVSYTLGNSANSITIGGSTGQVAVTSSNSTAGSIYIYNSLNTAAAVGAISVGGALSFTQTSATRNYMNFDYGFAPTSGTAIHNQLSFTGTINQSGGANGIVRGINLAHTMTAAADYRAIEIADNLANAHGIYQTGALTKNVFVGKTTFGATTSPTARLMLAAGTTAATTAPAKLISGPLMTTAEVGAVEFLTDAAYLTTTTGTVRRMLVGSKCARATGQTAANSSVATFTTPAVDGTYEVSGHITVTTSSAEAFSLTVDYTDESNTARTAIIPILRSSTGAWLSVTLSVAGAVAYPSATIPIRCKASTAITIKTSGTFTGCTYNVEGCIKQVN